ncbi:hypothetical protein C7W93_15240 [Glaciimonas sp. PCH181]|nr:hypothetical protein C7W93_15240 [Glaciimonas sp. PCH181]
MQKASPIKARLWITQTYLVSSNLILQGEQRLSLVVGFSLTLLSGAAFAIITRGKVNVALIIRRNLLVYN